MEKYFVTYEQALALKELGFDMPCFGYYVLKDYQLYYDTIIDRKNNSFRNNTAFNLYDDLRKKIAAPLKSQVFEWFREKYNYIFQIHYLYNGNYQLVIHKNTHEYVKMCESYPRSYSCVDEEPDNYSYEEAESNCVDKLIELVKNLKK